MADCFAPAERSRIMARVRGRDTQPELTVRRLLHAAGFRYRLHDPCLPGRPDIVLVRYGKVVQVHGCFWHGHRGCSRATIPATNTAFWKAKIEGNRSRDARVERQLRRWGWSVMTVWECQVRDLDRLERRLRAFVSK
jgi:DNA mismatch endonuclease (patch repair protein)